MVECNSRLHVDFQVVRSLFDESGHPSTRRAMKNFAPGITWLAQGTIDCPSSDCDGSVEFTVELASRSAQGSILEKSAMRQLLPEAVVNSLRTSVRGLFGNGELLDPFLTSQDIGFAGHHHDVPDRRVDCPRCGLTYSATPAQRRAILESAASWVAELTPNDVPIWDENEDGLLTPNGERLKPGIVTYSPFSHLIKPQAET